jgi:glycosyltransferase involved in cell wall biosynthesis
MGGMSRYSPRVSVILCTYNPVYELLQWALNSLENQTFPKSDFEVIVVDNNSKPPLDQADAARSSLCVRLIREPRQGLSFARCAGISEAKGEILVFMDDDNHFAPDYLEKVFLIAASKPEIGLFGGVAREVLEEPIPQWKTRLLPYLAVRDYGADPITSYNDFWGKWEPVGAGMAARRDVAEQFVKMVEADSLAGRLGRSGTLLLSAEDSLFARIANRLGYACSYQPSLKLLHFIKRSRLVPSQLARNLEGQGRSFVILRKVLGKPVEEFCLARAVYFLLRRFLSRVNQSGFRTGIINWFWDYGYLRECRAKAKDGAGG